ncbi:MAG TPA: hypothetical protein VJW76_00645 [Verrucomicrobiae bacterium]|nr:hypothetical protein [Verrucomicrobiae bacterium]
MKPFTSALVLALAIATTTFGGPLQKEQVGSDAKWLLHLDLDKFRASKVGTYFTRQVLEQKLSQPKADLKREFNFDLDISKISSITAYGTDYGSKPDANGVLVIKTTLDVEKALDSAIEKLSANAGEGQGGIKKTQQGSTVRYSINDDVFVTLHPGNLVVVAKSREPNQKASEVLAGKSANLTSGKAFSGFPDVQKAFFFLGVAEAFNADVPIPPQANVLKMADGGRLVLGENADRLFLNVALKAKSSEVVTQIQQVIQGLVALASLSKTENKDLMQLAQSARVSADENLVSLNLEFPVERAIEKLSEENRHNDRSNANSDKKKKDD